MQHQSNAPNQPAADHQSMRYANGRPKRIFDLTTGVVLSIITAPIILLLAVGSAVSFRAWPLFVQDRLGRGGRSFNFVKIRSLPTNILPTADKYAVADVTNTKWGQIIRGSHLDELPQCWLVVTGRMSLVGPRPEMPTLAATFDDAFVAERLTVRPGITGPWQVSTASKGLIGEAPGFDRLYLAHAGPRLDAWIMFRTIGAVVGLRPLPLERLPKWIDNRPALHGTPATNADMLRDWQSGEAN
jgi:lipopolysaccharide/colanic/teichoic acid biosynthesis glycosyltransferase